MPIRSDRVERSVAAAAITTVHGGIATAEPLAHLRQPIAIGGFVILVGVDGLIDFLARQTAGVNHLAVSRLEVQTLDEVGVNRAAPAEIGRAAVKGDLRPAS